jgi:GTPase SAR1 family protein
VYDVCSLKSFEDITKYWLNEISSFADKQVMLMLLGNKSDMGDAPREVDREMAEHFARSNSMKHYEVSAKTADQVHHAYKVIGRKSL